MSKFVPRRSLNDGVWISTLLLADLSMFLSQKVVMEVHFHGVSKMFQFVAFSFVSSITDFSQMQIGQSYVVQKTNLLSKIFQMLNFKSRESCMILYLRWYTSQSW